MRPATYKEAGVDIAGADVFKRRIAKLAKASFRQGVLKDIGGFGSFFALPRREYKDPVLVSSADGVGTKLKIAFLTGRHDSVGIDAVAMNTNDILCTGAQPLFFLDYIAHSNLKPDVLMEIVKGIIRGCRAAGCALIGGETAQMPGMYAPGEYDLAGFCVGVVERSRIIDGSRIEPGNAVVGLSSSGLHSNGFSLVRKILSRRQMRAMAKELLTPTRIYTRQVMHLLGKKEYHRGGCIRGIAHITGGAFYDKIARILPASVGARINKNAWPLPPVFRFIQRQGAVEDRQMYHTFNMGVGMVLIVDAHAADSIVRECRAMGVQSWVIGEIVKAKREVRLL